MAIAASFRPRISHTGFCVLFPALLYATCNALVIDRQARWFYGRDGTDYLALSAYLLAGLCVFVAFFTLLAHRRTVKPLAIALTVVSAAVTYFIAKYDVAVDSSMVRNVLHTDATEVGQLLSAQMIPYVVGLVVVPVALIHRTQIDFAPPARYLLQSLALAAATLAVALAALYLNYNAIHRAGNVSRKYIVYSLVPVNFLAGTISVAAGSLRPLLASRGREVRITGTVSAPGDLVVVLAIGEASRRRNFAVYGYGRRDTTPVLRSIDGLHLLNGTARHGSTLYALPDILEQDDVKLPAVVAGLGIPTACYVNYTLYDNCAAVGETRVRDCGHGGRCYDEDVIPLLAAELRGHAGGYRFVVLHLGGGSHGPAYDDRYPPEFQRFQPTCNDADVANRCSLEQLYNSYDNTILYVDHVLGGIVRTLDAAAVPYVFIYLSDHGESLLEDGRLFHGMPPGLALPAEQAEIPLIVKSSIPIAIVARDAYPSHQVFDTVLELFSISSPMFDRGGAFIRRGAAPARADGGTPPAAADR